MTRCTIGVFAHNEAHNVRRTLHALLAQQLRNVEITEIIVIASGCTDGTVQLAEEVASAYPLVTVDVETTRRGKAAAIKRLTAMARGEIIVLVGADTLPAPTAIQRLVEPFVDPTVGMTGARVVPLNAPTKWLGFAVQMLWHVHHQLALRRPKLGELVAFRNVIDDFPEDTSTDEPAIEALIINKGYRLAYAPRAVVYNRGPEDFREFVNQRRRVFAGQVRIALRYRYLTSSLKLRHVLPLTYEAIRSYPRYFVWILGAMAVEVWARLFGLCDALKGREDVVWRPATTSKTIVAGSERADLTLISVNWPGGSMNSAAFLRELRRLRQPVEPVFWWDGHKGEILLRLQTEDAPLEWIQTQIQSVSRDHVTSERIPASALVSCRLVRFFSASAPVTN